MSQDDSPEALLTRLRAGDEEAARQIYLRFAQRLIALARSRLAPPLRQKVDPEDVVQSAFRSFFARHAEGQFDLAGWDGFWGLLVVITLRKCGHRVEYFRAACRDVQREVAPRARPDESAADWEAMAGDPTPSHAAMLHETVEHLMRDLDGRDRRILELSLQGEPAVRISAELGCSERTVERVQQRIGKRLQRQRDQDKEER